MSASDAHRPAQDRGPEDEFDLDLDLDLDFGVEEPQPQPQPQTQTQPQPEPIASEPSPFELDLGSEPSAAELAPANGQSAAFESEGLDVTDQAPEGAYARPEEAVGPPPFEADGHGDGAPASGFDADALEIEFEESDQDTGSPRPRGVVAAAAVAGALMAAALAVVAPRSAPSDEVSTVAQASAEAAPDRELPLPDAPAIDAPAIDAPATDAPSTELTSTDAGSSESAESGPERSEPTYFEPPEGEPAFEEPSFDLAEPGAELGRPVAGEVVGAHEDASRATRTAELDVLEQVLLPEDRTGVEFVSPDEMDDIWLDEELPPGGVAARVHRLTPRVGPVRLITNLGEVFEGELYSIGAGELSLSNHLGRMSFSGRQVQSVERLPHLGAEGLDGVGGDLPGVRVRVRVPGGWIYGRLLAEDQGRVTLLTDSGGQVTLDADEVQRVGDARRGAFPSEDQEGIDEALRGESQ
jgi:hypothetical protein